MFSVGHLAFGYLTGRASSKVLDVNINLPLLFLISVLPDFDILISAAGIEHRGATHSLVVLCTLSLPAVIIFKKRSIPYFIALIQHTIPGDFFTSDGVQIFWPITSDWYGGGIKMAGITNISLEWVCFLACVTVMIKTRDAWTLFRHHPSNLLYSLPAFAVFLQTFLGFPLPVPPGLLLPHLAYLTLFIVSILIDLKSVLKTSIKY